jgi:hypothetical protein
MLSSHEERNAPHHGNTGVESPEMRRHSAYVSMGWDAVTGQDIYFARCVECHTFEACGTDQAKATQLIKAHDREFPRVRYPDSGPPDSFDEQPKNQGYPAPRGRFERAGEYAHRFDTFPPST